MFVEDFENGLPMGWTTNGIFEVTNSNDFASQYFAPTDHTQFVGANDDALLEGGEGDSRMETAMIDLTNAPSDIELTFESAFPGGAYGAGESAFVEVSTDGGATWDLLFDIPGNGSQTAWTFTRVPLPYDGQQIMLAFEYDDGDGWNFGLALDDIIIRVEPTKDAELLYVNEESYMSGGFTGGTLTPGVAIRNNGKNDINSIDLIINDGVEDVVHTFTDLNLAPQGIMPINAPQMTIGEDDITLSLSIGNVNGEGDDENTANDVTEVQIQVSVVTPHPDRGVVAEEATGSWCQFCPRGAVFLEGLTRRYPQQFIGIAVHNGDPMVNSEYDGSFDVSGYPSGRVERDAAETDPSAFENPFVQAVTTAPPARIDVGAEYVDGELTVSVGAELLESLGEDHTLAAILVEDHVTGTSSGYAQVNAYAGAEFSMGGYEFLPQTVPASDMVYDHVGRVLVGGFNGVEGTITEGGEEGEQHVEIFPTFNLNPNYDYDNLHIVAVLIHNPPFGAKKIKNAWSKTLDDAIRDGLITVGTIDLSSIEDVKVFPNPFQEETQVTLNLKESADVRLGVYDATGKAVFSQNYGELLGQNTLTVNTVNFEEGNYFFQVIVENQTITKMATKVK